jgi:superfamily II DNA/RNA helicase
VNPTFADLGVPRRLVSSMAARGITEPFPIQVLTLPDGLAGRDVSGKAPTGCGKTLAFGIPTVLGVDRAEPRRPRRLVLVPTRELATQVGEELKLLAGPDGPRVLCVFGGVSIERQAQALRRGVEIVVACPGRLEDLIQQRLVRLDDVELVVLDEADRMADMGFLPAVKRLLDQCPSDRRTLLFSATLDGDVDVLVRRYQHDPVRHELEVPAEDAADADHHFWTVERTERVTATAQLVDLLGPTVVFCRTKRGADRVAKQLNGRGVAAVAIHGDRSQAQRDRALQAFRDGRADALVATDVAARGIHVDEVAAVIHFDPVDDHKDYVHRSGRTARAGASGVVISLVTPETRSQTSPLHRRFGDGAIGPVDLSALPARSPRRRARPAALAPESNGGHHRGPKRPARGRKPGTDERRRREDSQSRTGSRSGGERRSRDGERPARAGSGGAVPLR